MVEDVPDTFCDPNNPVTITFNEITSAAFRLRSGIKFTDCAKSEGLSELAGVEIYLKEELKQATGSFKDRGVRFAMLMLTPEMKTRGIVTASTGNHALACCYHGSVLNVPVTVVMPEISPIMKVQKCKNYGGEVIIRGRTLEESIKIAKIHAKGSGKMYLNGYDHPYILAGQGTIGLEIWDQVPDLDAVLVPVGGGALIAGVCVALKSLDKNIKLIGVEPERSPCLTEAMKSGRPVDVHTEKFSAEGLHISKVGVNSFENIKDNLDKCVTVREQYIALAVLKLLEYEKRVVEGAGASGLAAILQGMVPELRGRRVCLILNGGNIDPSSFGRTLDRGLAADGRLVKIKVFIPDKVGGIQDLTSLIGRLGVHIRDIWHERAWVTEDILRSEVKVICECRDRDHSLVLRNALINRYGVGIFNGVKFSNEFSKTTQHYTPSNAEDQVMSNMAKESLQQRVIDLEASTQARIDKLETSTHDKIQNEEVVGVSFVGIEESNETTASQPLSALPPVSSTFSEQASPRNTDEDTVLAKLRDDILDQVRSDFGKESVQKEIIDSDRDIVGVSCPSNTNEEIVLNTLRNDLLNQVQSDSGKSVEKGIIDPEVPIREKPQSEDFVGVSFIGVEEQTCPVNTDEETVLNTLRDDLLNQVKSDSGKSVEERIIDSDVPTREKPQSEDVVGVSFIGVEEQTCLGNTNEEAVLNTLRDDLLNQVKSDFGNDSVQQKVSDRDKSTEEKLKNEDFAGVSFIGVEEPQSRPLTTIPPSSAFPEQIDNRNTDDETALNILRDDLLNQVHSNLGQNSMQQNVIDLDTPVQTRNDPMITPQVAQTYETHQGFPTEISYAGVEIPSEKLYSEPLSRVPPTSSSFSQQTGPTYEAKDVEVDSLPICSCKRRGAPGDYITQ